MTQTTQFMIGAQACCSDGVCGQLSRVVIDPLAGTVTHLVIDSKQRHTTGRLVPLALLDTTPDAAHPSTDVRMHCTLADFDKLDAAEQTHFLPGRDYGGYGHEQTFMQPYYGLGGMGSGAGMGIGAGALSLGMDAGMSRGNLDKSFSTETVPHGEISLHRGDHVHATDGEIGRVQDLVIAAQDHRMTHVLLQEGHQFTRKDVAIPITAITRVTDGIHLNITKQQVEDLPPVDIEHPTT